MKTTVWITTDFIDFHRWPEASNVLPERSYLGDLHRHKFHVRVEVRVSEDNRQVEFHDLKDNVDAMLGFWRAGGTWKQEQSCEQIAKEILRFVETSYPRHGWYSVTVSEDGENGATVVQDYEDA